MIAEVGLGDSDDSKAHLPLTDGRPAARTKESNMIYVAIVVGILLYSQIAN